MISGIMPCSKWRQIGYPWQQAISCWTRVCDEIILVVDGIPQAQVMLGHVVQLNKMFVQAGSKCDIRVHAIMNPKLDDFGDYGSYLMYGVCLASNPDWMIAIEADYLISPDDAGRLRRAIQEAPQETELVTAKAVTMNYTGTHKVYLPDFKNWFPPRDGFTWERPIASRVSAGIYPGMYLGIDRHNFSNTCEGFIRLRPGPGWGQTYHSKNKMLYGHNGFKILDTGIEFEHLTFTKNVPNILSKMESQDGYYKKQSVDLGVILEGHKPHEVVYQELGTVAMVYADREKELKEKAGF